MAGPITIVYENGVLRPLNPLPLQERQRVQIQILPTSAEEQGERAIQALVSAGLLTPPAGRSTVDPLSEEVRLDLSRRLGEATIKPPSKIIIEERGER